MLLAAFWLTLWSHWVTQIDVLLNGIYLTNIITINYSSKVPSTLASKLKSTFCCQHRACPLVVIVKWFKPLTVLSGTVKVTVYRLASSLNDHALVLFNVFEDWNQELVVLHISFVSFVINNINYWFLNTRFDLYSVGLLRHVLRGIYGWFDSRFES